MALSDQLSLLYTLCMYQFLNKIAFNLVTCGGIKRADDHRGHDWDRRV